MRCGARRGGRNARRRSRARPAAPAPRTPPRRSTRGAIGAPARTAARSWGAKQLGSLIQNRPVIPFEPEAPAEVSFVASVVVNGLFTTEGTEEDRLSVSDRLIPSPCPSPRGRGELVSTRAR